MKQSKVVKLADQLYFALDRARLQSFPVVAPLYVRFWRITVLRRYAANFRPPPERKGERCLYGRVRDTSLHRTDTFCWSA
ncbi:hypothetical protein GHK80_08860 [Sinorhizobium medicae]|nr:hypothetical protein [Sinorhizobium medicae]RVI55919.1 hypothetical protein CN192_14340 [Sinorhizobium medicae]